MRLRLAFALIPLALFPLAGCGHGRSAVGAGAAEASPLPASSLHFTDIARQAGVNFVHNNGAFGAKLLPETMGSGVAFIDYDGDGYPDLLVINGRDWTDAEIAQFKNGNGKQMASQLPANPPRRGGTCRLYHNNGDGTFTDVTAGSGLDIPMFGMGVAIGDYDNDGKPDIYITAVGRNYLFHNETAGEQGSRGAGERTADAGTRGRGDTVTDSGPTPYTLHPKPRFREVAEQLGVEDAGWSTSAAWLDYDHDGKLDLFVCHYVQWSPATDIWDSVDGHNKAYTRPDQYTGEVSRLYHNDGGHFTDVSQKAGILQEVQNGKVRRLQGKSLGVTICDFDNDGWPDIVVANDTEPNYLFRNYHNGTFTEMAVEAGIAYGADGTARAAMGTDSADLDHSGRESLLFGNFSNQMLGLYKNHGSGLFIDMAPQSDVGAASRLFLTFGVLSVDLDNDGWPDILTANGHLDSSIDSVQKMVTYAERPLLFRNLGRDRFREIGLDCGDDFRQPVVARGLAVADINLNGNLDIAMTTNGGPLRLLRNDGGSHNGSVRITLEGTKSNRSGIGAVVEAQVGTDRIRRMVRSGSSYLSASELPVTIGLGAAPKADKITVAWPSGAVTELKDVPANQMLVINEDRGQVSAAPFQRR